MGKTRKSYRCEWFNGKKEETAYTWPRRRISPGA
jgi:uncharacterized protein YodC (DUF2158 family)